MWLGRHVHGVRVLHGHHAHSQLPRESLVPRSIRPLEASGAYSLLAIGTARGRRRSGARQPLRMSGRVRRRLSGSDSPDSVGLLDELVDGSATVALRLAEEEPAEHS
jgi:hypothetical protein